MIDERNFVKDMTLRLLQNKVLPTNAAELIAKMANDVYPNENPVRNFNNNYNEVLRLYKEKTVKDIKTYVVSIVMDSPAAFRVYTYDEAEAKNEAIGEFIDDIEQGVAPLSFSIEEVKG